MNPESSYPTDRSMLLHLLSESDPEEVCGILKLSTRDILLAFPKKVDAYIKNETTPSQDEDDYETPEDEY